MEVVLVGPAPSAVGVSLCQLGQFRSQLAKKTYQSDIGTIFCSVTIESLEVQGFKLACVQYSRGQCRGKMMGGFGKKRGLDSWTHPG